MAHCTFWDFCYYSQRTFQNKGLKMTLEKLKLAAISQEFSDAEVEEAFLDLSFSRPEELEEAFMLLNQHRPRLLDAIALKHLSGPRLSN